MGIPHDAGQDLLRRIQAKRGCPRFAGANQSVCCTADSNRHADTILGTLRTLGPTATIGELIGATTGLELLAAASALGASFYVGAVIGSLIVATDASLVCDQRGVVAVDGIRGWATRRGLAVPQDVYRVIALHPEVFHPTPGSATFAIRARAIGRAIA